MSPTQVPTATDSLSRLETLLSRRIRGRRPALPPVPRPAGAQPLGGWPASVTPAGPVLSRPAHMPRRDPLLALVQRIGQGFRLEELDRARSLGYEAYLEEQLDPFALDDSLVDARLAGLQTLGMRPRELIDLYGDDFAEPYVQLLQAPILRAVHSRRQLFERLCEFWNDHFSISQNKEIEWALLPEFDRDVIRAGALGTFPELLHSVAHSGAMLFYLDNWLNVRGAPQENYARELLELHTLGLRGGYDEADVKEVAKCFTGWTLDGDLRPWFFRLWHESGPKLVLGHVIENLEPRANARKVIDLVAAHPSTARFLAGKLTRWFLTPDPEPALVERVAAEYLATGGDIKAMLRVILARENLGTVGPIRPKFRRPFHLVTGLLRALGADVTDATYPLYHLYAMGHVPYGHVQPDGYPDTVEAWGTSLLARWRFASDLLQSASQAGPAWPGVALSRSAIAARVGFAGAGDTQGLARRINTRVLSASLSEEEERWLQSFVDGSSGTFGTTALLEAIALGASLPGHQWF